MGLGHNLGLFLLTPVQCKANFFPSDYPPPDFEHLPTIQMPMGNIKLHLRALPNDHIRNKSLSEIGAWIRGTAQVTESEKQVLNSDTALSCDNGLHI